jgi:MarR family transcriptional regulator for hemolysin
MLQFDFENSVAYWIFATAHQLACTINEELAALGITHRQWEVLAWISFAGEMSQTELAEKMGIEAPTLVGVLDRMERDGWIVRIPSEVDRRKKMIRPTEKVEPVWAQMVACGMGIRARATRGLGPEQLQGLRDTLETMRKNLAKPVNTDKLNSANADKALVSPVLSGDVPA